MKFKPVVAQLKAGVTAQNITRSVTPPVYRPQPVAKVLQTKNASRGQQASQTRRQPAAPPAYRPQAQRRPVVPLADQAAAKKNQPNAISQQRRSPTPPPVYRPEQKRIAQPKTAAVGPAHKLPTAPTPYRPQPAPRVLQTKISSTQHAHQKPGIEFLSGGQVHGRGKPAVQMKRANVIQRMEQLFGKKEGEDIFDLLGENFEKNQQESEATGVQPLYGDPDLVRIYRTEIQTNPSYKTMEPEVRKSPLTMIWVPDARFGPSSSRAAYDGEKHTIEVAESLKGNTDKIVSFIEFELLNAKSKPVLLAIGEEFGKDKQRHVLDYTGIPMFNPADRRPINEQLATAKMVVAMEREEYANVIRLEKALQVVGKHSMFYDHLQGGVQARWSCFANYLRDQCASGHYLNLDPQIQQSTWNGWRFVTDAEKIAKDPLA